MRIRYFIALIFLCSSLFGVAKDIPPKPNPPRLVNDFAGMLTPAERETLEKKLVVYNDSTSTQVAIVTIRSLEGEDDFDYALKIYNTWNIGQKDKNNGVLIFIALDDRKIRFITGYGAEGFLPDAIAKRIIENIIKPAFKGKNYYDGFNRATDAIISYGAGEYKAEPQSEEGDVGAFIIFLIIVIIIIFVIINSIRRSNRGNDDDDNDGGLYRGGRYDERNRGGGGWIFIPPIGGGGGWNSGGSSGGGGIDFGGFGGGFSGGGGAGGDW